MGPDTTLASFGVGPGAKVMVLGKKFDPSEDTDFQAVVKVKSKVHFHFLAFIEFHSSFVLFCCELMFFFSVRMS